MDKAFFIVAVRRDVVSADGILILTCRIRFAFAPSLAIERSPPLKRNMIEYIVFPGRASSQSVQASRLSALLRAEQIEARFLFVCQEIVEILQGRLAPPQYFSISVDG